MYSCNSRPISCTSKQQLLLQTLTNNFFQNNQKVRRSQHSLLKSPFKTFQFLWSKAIVNLIYYLMRLQSVGWDVQEVFLRSASQRDKGFMVESSIERIQAKLLRQSISALPRKNQKPRDSQRLQTQKFRRQNRTRDTDTTCLQCLVLSLDTLVGRTAGTSKR